MKKILMAITLLFSIIILTGCGNETKEKITADEFYNRINEDFKLYDITSHLDYVKKAYSYDEDGIKFYFYEGNKSFDMGNIYLDEVQNAASSTSNKQDEIYKGENFSSIIIQNNEKYYRIAYVDNTLLYGETTPSKKAKIDEIFNKAGY